MKRIVAWLLLAAAIVGLCGCAGESPVPETTAPVVTEAAAEPVIAETELAETEPAVLEGSLYLKVSAIDFSLVGESEDIYLGTVPRELITWESEDPSIVSVENGVLTANGVGTTTIRGTYEDRQVECQAGCLAQTQEALNALDRETLCKPKRLPPELDLTQPCTAFDNAAIVGDSITWGLLQWESKNNFLGDILFLCRGGVSLNGFVRRIANIYYRGQETDLWDAIGQSGVGQVYFLLGANDITEEAHGALLFDNWETLVERIREKSPDVEIILMTQIPNFDKAHGRDKMNRMIAEYNEKLAQFAQEHNCQIIDLAYYVTDHLGRMPKAYSLDYYHLNEAGCLAWMKVLRYYAQYKADGGILG